MADCCDEYGLARVKRDRVPEWLWAFLCHFWLPFFGYLILIQPFLWMLTREPTEEDVRRAAGCDAPAADEGGDGLRLVGRPA